MITIIVLYILLGIIAFFVIILHFSVRVKLSAASGDKPVIEVKWLFVKIYPRKKKQKSGNDDTSSKAEYTDEEIDELIRQADDLPSVQDDDSVEHLPEPESNSSADDTPKQIEQSVSEKTDEQDDVKENLIEEKEKTKEEKSSADDEAEEKKSGLDKVKGYWNMVKPYIPMAWKYFRKLLKCIRITKLDVQLVSGKDDAYEAAMMYGKLNAALSNTITMLGGIFTVQTKNMQVYCKFNEKLFEYDVSAVVLVRPSTLIAIVFCVGVNFLRIWLGQKIKARRERRREKRIAKKQAKLQRKSKINETELLANE